MGERQHMVKYNRKEKATEAETEDTNKNTCDRTISTTIFYLFVDTNLPENRFFFKLRLQFVCMH